MDEPTFWTPPTDRGDDYWRRARYVDHYDGDTITLTVDLGYRISVEERVRLIGIDTPELRGDERAAGLAAKDFVFDWMYRNQAWNADNDPSVLPEWPLLLRSSKAGKYGRWLGEIWSGQGMCLNQDLLDSGHATIYGS